MTRHLGAAAAFLIAVGGLGLSSTLLERRAAAQAKGAVQAPRFEVDPLWPKPLPNKWILGQTIGVSVDAQDHVWIIHRAGSLEPGEVHATTNPPTAQCCAPAPPILEFDAAGNLVGHWGGPGQGYDWPDSNHGITVDYKGNVWIGGNGRGPSTGSGQAPAAGAGRGQPAAGQNRQQDESQVGGVQSFNDNMVLKFTRDGKFLMQIGKPRSSKGSNDLANLRLPAKTFLDKETNELYVADGYGNHRVIVFDADTGAFKRTWGAFGKPPGGVDNCAIVGPKTFPEGDGPPDFNVAHAIRVANDGMVYLADRENRRLQMFSSDGKFVKQIVRTATPFARDLAFSPDQKLLYVGGGKSIVMLDAKTLDVLGEIAVPGQIGAGHHIATDSKGNIYIAQTTAGLQKLVFKGMAAVAAK